MAQSTHLRHEASSQGVACRQRNSFATIIGLLCPSCPAAVFRTVSLVIVDAIQSVFRRWPVAHIRQKIIERITPPGTRFDATLAVPFVRPIVGIGAALPHVRPDVVFRKVGMSISSRVSFGVQASAGLCVAPPKALSTNNTRLTTQAQALKGHMAPGADDIGGSSKYGEAAKDATSHVGVFHMFDRRWPPSLCQGAFV